MSSRGGPTINVIEEGSNNQWIKDVIEVKTSLTEFHARLVESCLILERHDECIECSTQPKGFQIVQRNVQCLMDRWVIQISRAKNTRDVYVIEPHFELPTPVDIV